MTCGDLKTVRSAWSEQSLGATSVERYSPKLHKTTWFIQKRRTAGMCDSEPRYLFDMSYPRINSQDTV